MAALPVAEALEDAGDALVHASDPVRPRREVPSLDQHSVTGFFQGPGDPLRPRSVWVQETKKSQSLLVVLSVMPPLLTWPVWH